MIRLRILLLSYLAVMLWACEDDMGDETPQNVITQFQVINNPSGYAPLTSKLMLTTNSEVTARLRIVGQRGSASDVIQEFNTLATEFEIPVLGLYPDYENKVELTLFSSGGNQVDSRNISIQTDPLIEVMPEVRIDVPNSGGATPGWNFVNYFGFVEQFSRQYLLMFDEFGDVRWFLDYEGHPELDNIFVDNGMSKLQNGNLICGNGRTGTLYEIDMLGEIINTWPLQGYGFHHHVIEKPNGNLLTTVNAPNKATVEDEILEIDRSSGQIVNRWDLTQSLDKMRRAWPTDLADLDIDWFHGNGLEYSESDDCIIVSGRTQGTVKLTADNEVVWILAPHREWETSGNGQDLNQFLLQPLDAVGNAIEDAEVLDGATNHPDFEWSWYQHSPILLPNGNLMIFDNGDTRNYSGQEIYSRAVEYEIDEENMTIKQVWDYGKERRRETYSRIVSKVSYHRNEGNVLFTPGATFFDGVEYGKAVEIDRQSNQVVFEATVIPPDAFFGISFHNVLRMSLY